MRLHVVHLDHETRAGASAADAVFVAELAASWGLPATVARRSDVEAGVRDLPANRSARYRAARFALFGRVVREQDLSGVLLAHHADDQAETVLQRLLRGAGLMALAGMSGDARVAGVRVLRPLLGVRRQTLRAWLVETGQAWREDESNRSDAYLRNRLRRLLGACDGPGAGAGADSAHAVGVSSSTAGPVSACRLRETLLELGEACAGLRAWSDDVAPRLGEAFGVEELAGLPTLLARRSAARWLRVRDCPPAGVTTGVVDRLILMAADAASPSRQDFPGGVSVRRRGGRISS